MHTNIICDASYDHHTKICGISGVSLLKNNDNLSSSYLLTEIDNSNEAELYAIQLSLVNTIKQSNGIKSDSLTIHTDSENSINYLIGNLSINSATDKIKMITTDIVRALNHQCPSGNINIAKVKSHVNDRAANYIEKTHNSCDIKAKELMRSLRDPLIYPDANLPNLRNENVILSLSKSISNNNLKQIINEVKNISKSGSNLHYDMTGNKHIDRIIIDQFNDCSRKNKIITFDKIMELQPERNPSASYKGGLDRTINRAIFYHNDINFDSFINTSNYAAINAMESATKIFFGTSDGMLSIPSRIININTTNQPGEIGFWLDKYAGFSKTHSINNTSELNNKADDNNMKRNKFESRTNQIHF